MNAPLAIILDDEHRAQLDSIAAARGMDAAELAAQALTEFVENDAAIVAAIKEGLAAIEAGDVHDFEDVKREMDAYVAEQMRQWKA